MQLDDLRRLEEPRRDLRHVHHQDRADREVRGDQAAELPLGASFRQVIDERLRQPRRADDEPHAALEREIRQHRRPRRIREVDRPHRASSRRTPPPRPRAAGPPRRTPARPASAAASASTTPTGATDGSASTASRITRPILPPPETRTRIGSLMPEVFTTQPTGAMDGSHRELQGSGGPSCRRRRRGPGSERSSRVSPAENHSAASSGREEADASLRPLLTTASRRVSGAMRRAACAPALP